MSMSKDIECPYCEKEVDICHDDGFGYEEGVNHQMQCPECDKYFVFQTSISFYYEPYKADCLNEGSHKWNITNTYPKCCAKMECEECGDVRELTEQEKIEHNVGTWQEFIESIKTQPK